MPPRKEGHDEHGSDIDVARLAERIEGLTGRVDRMFAEISRLTDSNGRLLNNCAAHQQSSITSAGKDIRCDKWHTKIEAELQSLDKSRTEMNSSARTVAIMANTIIAAVVLIITIYNFVLARDAAHQRTLAEPAAQHQVTK